jgi:crotonobetainyl-CoA:carnitine CoA-transferase CaiB-like acyl-CoA transferase
VSGLLEGIHVVEFAAHGVGPICGLILANLGADVIKIENPAGGDPTRGYERVGMVKVPPGGHTIVFEFTNRQKRSLTLDVSKPQGLEIIHKLIDNADVFFSNYLPKSLKRLGFDYETLSKRNPKLVYAASSSFGKYGPDNNKGAFDSMALARSGLMMAAGEANTPPVEIRGTIADNLGGTMLAFGVVSGILARERLGVGQEIDSSLFGPLIWLQMWNIGQVLVGSPPMERESRTKPQNPILGNYKCKDGRWLKLNAYQTDPIWAEFCQVLNLGSIEKDPRFTDQVKRAANSEELVKILDQKFLEKARGEWVEYFKSKNVAFMYEEIKGVDELSTDPQALANNYIMDEDHPALGHIKSVMFPLHFSKTGVSSLKPAPQLGEHTEQILKEIGYKPEQIAQFKKDKII